ncbi:MAG: hypothetical protein ACTSU2_10555 [Promethearchaeota archaeon]
MSDMKAEDIINTGKELDDNTSDNSLFYRLAKSHYPNQREILIAVIIFMIAWIHGLLEHVFLTNPKTIDWDVFWAVNHHSGSPYDIFGYYWLPYGHYIYYPFQLGDKFVGWLIFSILIVVCGIMVFRLLYTESGLIAWAWITILFIPILFDIYFGNLNIILTLLLIISYKLAKKGTLGSVIIFPAIYAFTLLKPNIVIALPVYFGLLLFPQGDILNKIMNIIRRKGAAIDEMSGTRGMDGADERDGIDGIDETNSNEGKKGLLGKIAVVFNKKLDMKHRIIIGTSVFLISMVVLNIEFLIYPSWIGGFLKNFRADPQLLTNGVVGSIWLYFILEYYHLTYIFVIGVLYIFEFLKIDNIKILKWYSLAFGIWLLSVLTIRFFIYDPLDLGINLLPKV